MTARRLLPLLLGMAAASAAFGQGEVTITSTSPLPQGFTSIPYTYTFTGTTSIVGAAITWSSPQATAPTLPPGFSLSSNGILSGTTTESGTFTFLVIAQVGDFSASRTFSLTLINPSITINSPPALANGLVGQSYSVALSATSNPPGVTWSHGESQLPPGLTLSASGVLSGTPTTAGAYQFPLTAQITGTTVSTSQTFTLTVIGGQVTIQTSSLPFAFSGQPYSTTLSGSPAGITWSVTVGSLPSGITLNSATGVLAGTTSAVGVDSLTFQASAPNYVSATRSLPLTVTNGPLGMSPAVLPPAVQGSPYQTTVIGSGGLPPYQWSIGSASTLGLSIGAQTGIITGTLQASGSFLVPVTLSDSTGQSLTQNLSLFVATPLSVATTSLPNGTVGTAYSQSLLTGGGVSPFTWIVVSGSGSLPSGLALSSSGVISGTPSAAGTFHFTVQATDAGGRTATGALSILIGGGATPLTITTASLPNGQLTVSYSQTLAASGGVAPYTWSIASGTLPQGLTLSSNGTLTGTPAGSLGISSFTVQVADSSPTHLTAQKAFTIDIALTLTITTIGPLPNGIVSVAYSQTLAASGGTTPYTWSIASGTLPPGLQLSGAGVISGTPTATGTSQFTVMVTDASAETARQALSITITTLSITTGNLSATVGTAFSQTLAASGGTPPYAFSITSGTLPAGLQLSNNVISGTPTAAGTANVTLKLTDSQQRTATASITITVNLPPAPTVTIGTISGITATQPSVSLALGNSFPVNVTGTLSVGFQPGVGGNPTEVQFITSGGGSSTVGFSVPAGTTNAIFSNAPVLATGTVAGTITLTATLSAGGVNVTPTPTPTETIVIAPSAPVIESVNFSNTGGSLTVTVTGYSTTREMVSGQFTFAPATGSTLSQSAITVQLGSAYSTWYQSSASNQYGGQFLLTAPFSVSGTAAAVASVSVTLTNTQGTSGAASPP